MTTCNIVTSIACEDDLRQDSMNSRWTHFSTLPMGELRLMFREWAATMVPRDGLAVYYPNCFCCPGNTLLTNHIIHQVATGKGVIRVTTNRGIKLESTGRPRREGRGQYNRMTPYGTDEVVIIGDEHDQRLASIPIEMLAESFFTSRQRVNDLHGNPYLTSFMVWCDGNQVDPKIGVYSHPRFHVSSRATVLPRLKEEMEGCAHYFFTQGKERCIMCDAINDEIQRKGLVISVTKHFVMWAPYASRYPFEVWIAPLKHYAFFNQCFEDDPANIRLALSELASLTQQVLSKLEILFGPRFPFTATIHTGPRKYKSLNIAEVEMAYHMKLRIVADLGPTSVYERALGENEHAVLPEVAAELLRMSPEDLFAWINS
jgi:UDPglucose--hexose-1-phosphate uridylyltransferase